MKLCSLLTLLLVSANAKELFLDQYTELAATTKTAKTTPKTLTPAEKKEKEAAAKKAKEIADAKELKTKCSPLWKKKHGWTFGCMWDKPGM